MTKSHLLPELPIPAPPLKPFADNRQWMLYDDLDYSVGDSEIVISVPAGFVTDFASIPQIFWSTGLSPDGTYSRAAVVHDFLYWTQACSKSQADNILMIAMKESNVPTLTRDAIYEGVHLGGNKAWSDNTAERASGLPRVIPQDKRNFGPLVLWKDYQQELFNQGVRDPQFPATPPYCPLGNSNNVP